MRRLKNVTQKELAIRTGFTQSYISKLGRGVQSPTLKTVAIIASALEIHPFQLMNVIEKADSD